MAQNGTKQAFNNVFKATKLFTISLEERINNKIVALEEKVTSMRNLYEKKLNELQISQRKQLDTLIRNNKNNEEVIIGQQDQITLLQEQCYHLLNNQNKITDFLNAVIQSHQKKLNELEDKFEKK